MSHITLIPRAEQFAALGLTSSGKRKKKSGKSGKSIKRRAMSIDHIAVLDMETDPFDNTSTDQIRPFLAVIYSENFTPIVIWEDYPPRKKFVPPHYNRTLKNGHRTDAQWEHYHKKLAEHNEAEEALEASAYKNFTTRVHQAITDLPDRYTIYAHNGGKFDFLFLLPELRGPVTFKGRGIMAAKIGNHELRDSFNLIPASLKSANRKDEIDYALMSRSKRTAARDEIITYCISDCRYLLELVKQFVTDYGFKISIGQAAMKELKRDYETKNIGAYIDALIRPYYHGGRVECLAGAGHFKNEYCLFDVNSMYPAVMRDELHPIGNGGHYYFRCDEPEITDATCFITLECINSGALLGVEDDGTLTSRIAHGVFNTSIHEYRTALRLGLLSDIRVIKTVECSLQTNFAKFVDPLYNKRRELIVERNNWRGSTDVPEFYALERTILFLKLIMNNAYGKFAQDPQRFRDWYITDPNCEVPPDDAPRPVGAIYYDAIPDGFSCTARAARPDIWTAHYPASDYTLWGRPSINTRGGGFYNVGTAASITGAARARLMEAIYYANDPIYCDTDSILCRSLGTGEGNIHIDATALGAWKCEGVFREAYLAGKKSYALLSDDGSPPKIRHKGGSVTLAEMQAIVLDNATVMTINKGVTIARDGSQAYIERSARATAKMRD